MKVVLIGTAYPFRGGLASFNERLIKEYQKRGDEASIETFTLQYPHFLFPGKTQYSSSPAPNDILIIRRISSINPLNWLKVGLQIKKQKPDLVLVKFWLPFMAPCFGTILRIARSNKHTKVLCIVDNIIPHEKRFGDQAFSKYFVKSVDHFIAMSKSVMEDLKGFVKTNQKIVFSPHPIFDNFGPKKNREQSLKNLNIDSEYRYILFFGIIRDYKGLDILLESIDVSYFIVNKIKLIVAGEFYGNEDFYLEKIKNLDLDKVIIHFNRFIPDEEVGDIFCASELLVQPYRNATQSGVAQIAYHFEIPMVVTNVGGLPELVPHNKVGYVVEPDPKSVREAIRQFFEGSRKYEFVENLIIEKEKYSWKRMVENLDKLYKLD